MIFILLLLLCIFTTILSYYYIVHYGKNGQLINRIPGISTVPLFGNILEFSKRSSEEIWEFQNTLCNKYYPIFRIWSFKTAYVHLSHPDDIQVILSSTHHLEKGIMYTLLRPWLGTGLLTSKGTKWHERRKILTPTFHFNILKQFVNILIEEGNRMTKFLNDIEGSIVNDLVFFINQHTLNAICETSMGTSLETVGEYEQLYRHAVHEMGKILIYRLMRPWFYSDKLFALTSMGKKQIKNLRILHNFTEKVIAERKRFHKLTDERYLKDFENDIINTGNDEIIKNKKKRLSMLDFLIAASRNNKINDLDIREEIDTFMFEGHDTVAMTICFVILLLAEHKDIQDLARNEIDAVMQENGGQLTMTGLQNLSYLERCLKEAMRLYPSVPFIMRVLSKDVKLRQCCQLVAHFGQFFLIDAHCSPLVSLALATHRRTVVTKKRDIDAQLQPSGDALLTRKKQEESSGRRSRKIGRNVQLIDSTDLESYLVPSGTEIFISIYNVHRNPNFWPNPDIFDPDRFLPENIQNRHPFAYIPFSAGPRNCIGQRFALLELKAMVAPLVHNFYLEPVDYLKNLRHTVDIINRVTQPIHVRFIPIKRTQTSELI